MKLLGWFAIGLLLGLFATAALAAEPKAVESKPSKDRAECNKTADAVVAMAKFQHPLDVMKAKQDAYNACMAARAHPGSRAREK
jgi:hypothetical protein